MITGETLLRLALVPAAVWIASLAARRYGHAASGYLGGLPLIGGPITFYLALDHGVAFAATSATLTLAAILGQGAYLLAFAHAARVSRWPVALASGWASFALVSVVIAQFRITPGLALLLAVAGLACAAAWLPRARASTALPRIPAAELWLRLAAAFLLAVAIVWAAEEFGPIVSGILLSVPVTGSIMPPFTLALYGGDALARLTRGFVVGLTGFTAFFFTLAAALERIGLLPAFALAIAAALAMVFTVRHASSYRR